MQLEVQKLLFDACEAGRAVTMFVEGKSVEDYQTDLLLRSAVERQLFILGEALAQLKQRAPDVFDSIPEARRIVAFRNLLAHGYADLDDVRVWSIVETDLRATLDDLEALVEAEG